ncbi:MAG: glycosyltransferase [Candidatus Marinimicrobia bacterium]|nr:glycosyltransferase [candidate division WOR-3 bacterium]MCK4445845.1 glycosyltransferase [Candidatus Neomarinimicrobiota bacterium]
MLEICPKISVVMSVYNGEKYLREAIESILNQSFKDFEFVIIDDGSNDSSAEIIKSYNDPRIIIIQQESSGLAKALNNGIKKAKGKYIARMDADDISIPERLEKQLDFLENLRECVAVGSNAKVIDMNGEYLYISSQPSTWKEIKKKLPSSPFFHSSTMFRKDVAIECGGYYEEIRHHFEDMVLWNKMADRGELWNIEKPLIKYRLVSSAITNRSLKTNLIMHNICNNILELGTVRKSDMEILDKITKKKSENWKMSNYFLKIGKVYIERNFQRKKAYKNLILSIKYFLLNGKAWFNLILLFLPLSIIKKWKKIRGVY